MTAAEAGPAAAAAGTGREPRLALLPWGDLIEDFLDEIGVSLEDFSAKMTGGWLFGYVEALQLEGIQTSIICFSARVTVTTRSVHAPTGAEVVVVRAPAAYRWLRRRMIDPYGASAEKMFGTTAGVARHAARAARHLAPYLSTAVGSLAREIRRSGCGAILCQEYESATVRVQAGNRWWPRVMHLKRHAGLRNEPKAPGSRLIAAKRRFRDRVSLPRRDPTISRSLFGHPGSHLCEQCAPLTGTTCAQQPVLRQVSRLSVLPHLSASVGFPCDDGEAPLRAPDGNTASHHIRPYIRRSGGVSDVSQDAGEKRAAPL